MKFYNMNKKNISYWFFCADELFLNLKKILIGIFNILWKFSLCLKHFKLFNQYLLQFKLFNEIF